MVTYESIFLPSSTTTSRAGVRVTFFSKIARAFANTPRFWLEQLVSKLVVLVEDVESAHLFNGAISFIGIDSVKEVHQQDKWTCESSGVS